MDSKMMVEEEGCGREVIESDWMSLVATQAGANEEGVAESLGHLCSDNGLFHLLMHRAVLSDHTRGVVQLASGRRK